MCSIQTTVILAMSADGKIADQARSPARFGSPMDQAQLERQVAEADVVVFGAGTLRAYGTTMSVRSPALLAQRQSRGQCPQPVQMVCSRSGQLDPASRFFRQPVPRWLLTTKTGAQGWVDGASEASAFEQIWIAPERSGTWDWAAIWQRLAAAGFARVAVLGGGSLVAALFEAGLVQWLNLTVCPLILGGATAPTPVDGLGFTPETAPRLALHSVEALGDELFLQYQVGR